MVENMPRLADPPMPVSEYDTVGTDLEHALLHLADCLAAADECEDGTDARHHG